MITQICTKCKRELPATEEYFPKRHDGRNGGLNSWCRECFNKHREEYSKTRGTYDKERGKNYARKHRNERKQYREEHKERIKSIIKDWGVKHREERRWKRIYKKFKLGFSWQEAKLIYEKIMKK